ncbi:hypothetical protein [Brunnivagina elsteri]|uniref:Spore coat protein U domain-containing protein n=1 Tax=Brunnivagina elsteri CCALA 953 TaxID=987040 RepID=A0A2A2TGK7_9CYAN|nr:hypothetical protein [Calothrix elsteri]PAX52559.1 hypothetical protein CK510_18660 [Calothrix elsteri CCALA 953]
MRYRLALTSALVLTCVAATTTATLAESTTVEVQFSGTVPERTSISIPNQPGESLSGSSFKAIKSSQPGNNITNLRFNSTRSSDIIVSPPQFVSGSHPEPQGTTRSSLLKLGRDTKSTNATIPPGETDLQLQTLIKAPQNFPPGTYNYTTTLTIVP